MTFISVAEVLHKQVVIIDICSVRAFLPFKEELLQEIKLYHLYFTLYRENNVGMY